MKLPLFILLVSVFFTYSSCKKTSVEQIRETSSVEEITPEHLPPNPYDLIDYGQTPVISDPASNSLVGIHSDILQPKCAVPGCHDGHFEPDFRTVQSSYSTLVYHPIIKNNIAEEFKYRVIPGDTINSVLYERITNCCFVNIDDRMPQDNIGVPLPNTDIDNISSWINNGAQDIGGNSAWFPNLPPTINPFFLALDSLTYQTQYQITNNRLDSVSYNSFKLPNNLSVALIFLVEDDSTSISNMQVNELKLSNDPNNFSTAQSYSASYLYLPPPDDSELYIVWLNTGTLQPGIPYYMRYIINDGDQPQNVSFPGQNLPFPYKTFWSFIIQ